MADADEVRRAKILMERLVELALSMDGTCTGEHGVGQGKMKYLLAEHGAPALAAMAAIKRALDPQNIMNPGKIVALELIADIDLPPKPGKNSVHFISLSASAPRRADRRWSWRCRPPCSDWRSRSSWRC